MREGSTHTPTISVKEAKMFRKIMVSEIARIWVLRKASFHHSSFEWSMPKHKLFSVGQWKPACLPGDINIITILINNRGSHRKFRRLVRFINITIRGRFMRGISKQKHHYAKCVMQPIYISIHAISRSDQNTPVPCFLLSQMYICVLSIFYFGTRRRSSRTAHPLTARTMTIQAIKSPTRPIVAVYMNMASRP